MLRTARGHDLAAFASMAMCTALALSAGFASARELPAGKILEIRLTTSLASFSSRDGNEVNGIIIAPVQADGRIVIPMGAKVTGIIRDVNRVGSALIHESASIDLDFNKLVGCPS